MRQNQLRTELAKGHPVFGTMLQEARSPAIALIMANAGFSFVFLDLEHGVFGHETVADFIRVLRLAGVTPLVRVPSPDYQWIARMLDAGAQGIMVPRVESVAEVQHIVECVKYPPTGKRGCSVTKGHNDYQKADMYEFTQQANRENLIILQIERREAVEHIDELLAVPGVDVALIGPNDLALSLGVPMDLHDPILAGAIDRVVGACRKTGVSAGLHTANVDALVEWERRGMLMLTYSTDIDMLIAASAQGLASLRQGIAASPGGQPAMPDKVDREVPAADRQIAALRSIDTPTICNAIERFEVRDRVDGFMGMGIRCLTPSLGTMTGYAVTLTVDSTTPGVPMPGEAYYAWLKAMADSPKPAVLVMQDVGPQPRKSAHFGDVMGTIALRLGVEGLVTNGGVRDILELERMGLRCFAAGLVPSHGNPRLIDANVPVVIDGVSIAPGDLIHGDIHGVTVIPQAIAGGVADAAAAVLENEAATKAYVNSPEFTIEGLYRRKYEH